MQIAGTIAPVKVSLANASNSLTTSLGLPTLAGYDIMGSTVAIYGPSASNENGENNKNTMIIGVIAGIVGVIILSNFDYIK